MTDRNDNPSSPTPTPEAEEARWKAALEVIEAARCIRHWHDTMQGQGMIVSAEHVRLLWAALERYDALLKEQQQGQPPEQDGEPGVETP
ncbi:hypothetical protein [Teichococcus oryzae]|uniref:Uncharacterized protein n=1 Tax=Teichococcus oryzae TaxID=1608942 RepID=A0A5B2TAW2_9PROT|nr:hypothetical protein [Pseudoroseomonas oryzae]KAA2211666.1 hypothetical protein F0Q34_18975 [Pseudoroseomonas oryzae]